MTRYYKPSTGATPNLEEIRMAHPEMSIPDGAELSAFGYMTLTETPRPQPNEHCKVVEITPHFDGSKWVAAYIQQILTPQEEAELIGQLVDMYTSALEAMYDAKAGERRYDNRFSCALRAGYPGPFHDEALAFAQWMDGCNYLAYGIMGEVLAGRKARPTAPELLAMMPALTWP